MGGYEQKMEEMLTCPVCQDVFVDPRQLTCGHSLCKLCLENLRDFSSETPFRCPDCRQEFGPIIRVHTSYALNSIAEDFRQNRRKASHSKRRGGRNLLVWNVNNVLGSFFCNFLFIVRRARRPLKFAATAAGGQERRPSSPV